jgi:3-oxoacyl-[acyl-carrier protein] reductase
MSDVLLKISESGRARQLLKTIGLPLPLPAPLARADGPWEELPLAGRALMIASSSAAELPSELVDSLRRIVVDAGARATRPGVDERLTGVVLDATGLHAPEQLRRLYDVLHPALGNLAPGGRILLLARPVEEARSEVMAAAQGALDGFFRSLAKELGKKAATAQLVRVATGAEAELAPLLRFLLSARSAFITGQALSLAAPTGSPGAPAWVQPLANKVALVTGAARGIGEATVRRLAAEGAHVVCLDRPADARATAQVAAANAGSTLDCDLRDQAAPQAIADALRARHGGVDIVVHNAGVTRDKTLQRMSGEQWDEVIDVNLGAVIRIEQALASLLRDGGRVICVASIAGIAGTVGQTNYAAAKAGLIGYVRKRAPALAARGITVNAVAPGLIETRLTAAMPIFVREAGRRLSALAQGGEPRDVAEAITFLASPGAAGINGSVLRVCGGAFLGA